MNATCRHRMQVVRALRAMVPSAGEAVSIEQALDLCEASDVRQVHWELRQVGLECRPQAVLAMALSRVVVRKVSEQYTCQQQSEQAGEAVTRTGDKRST